MTDTFSDKEYSLRILAESGTRFIVAHRGSSGTAPENTLISLQKAIDAGASVIEVDVQLTKDNQAVLLHDPHLGRTTSGKGLISNYTYSELHSIDAGSWFDTKYSAERIPLLYEAIELLKKHKVFVNIEIKPPQPQEDFKKRVDAITDIVIQANMSEATLFGSFHHHSLAYVKKINHHLYTSAINVPGDKRLPSEIAKEINCDAFVCSLKELNHRRDDDAFAHKLMMGVYSINSEKDFEKIMKYKACALVSNFPSKLSDWLSHSQKQ